MLTEAYGVPIGPATDGANRHDMKWVEAAVGVGRPPRTGASDSFVVGPLRH